MTSQILQISNGYIIFESIEELNHAIFFPTKDALITTLKQTLPTINPKIPNKIEE